MEWMFTLILPISGTRRVMIIIWNASEYSRNYSDQGNQQVIRRKRQEFRLINCVLTPNTGF